MAKRTRTQSPATRDAAHQLDNAIASDPASKKKFDGLASLLKVPKPDSVLWLFTVGDHVRRLCQSEANDQLHRKIVAELAKTFGAEAPAACMALLYRGRRLASRFGCREIELLEKQISSPKSCLTRQHVTHLALLKDQSVRKSLLAKCVSGRWSARRLQREIRQHIGYPRRAGGRRVEPPAVEGLAAALRDVTVLSRRWVAYANSWCGGEKPLWQHPPADNLPEVRRELERAMVAVDELKSHVTDVRARLKEIQTETAPVKRVKSHGSAGR